MTRVSPNLPSPSPRCPQPASFWTLPPGSAPQVSLPGPSWGLAAIPGARLATWAPRGILGRVCACVRARMRVHLCEMHVTRPGCQGPPRSLPAFMKLRGADSSLPAGYCRESALHLLLQFLKIKPVTGRLLTLLPAALGVTEDGGQGGQPSVPRPSSCWSWWLTRDTSEGAVMWGSCV